jgi:lipopolysaccharide transport system permease protein
LIFGFVVTEPSAEIRWNGRMTVLNQSVEEAIPTPIHLSRMAAHEAPVVTRIQPPRGWQWINVGELWQYRELIYFLTWRDVKVRYKQTVLGAAWAILQPLLMMTVFTVFFARMAGVSSGSLPYPLFAYAGLLPWTFFATAIAAAGNSVIGSERLISKIYFPRLGVPFAAVGAAVVDFVIAFGLLVAMMAYYRVAPGPGMLLAPAIFVVTAVAALGVGTSLAALNVAYRDFRYVLPFLVQLWMFATPSVYMQVVDEAAAAASRPALPSAAETGGQRAGIGGDGGSAGPLLRAALALNPMTGLIAAFRASVLGGPIPWASLAGSSACALLAFLAGCFYFRRVEDGFADII